MGILTVGIKLQPEFVVVVLVVNLFVHFILMRQDFSVALEVLELNLYDLQVRLSWNSQRSTSAPQPPNARIKGVCHHYLAQPEF